MTFFLIQGMILEFELRKQRCADIGIMTLKKIPNNSQENTEDLTFNSNVQEYVNHE